MVLIEGVGTRIGCYGKESSWLVSPRTDVDITTENAEWAKLGVPDPYPQ
jgi:hypothetical protein